MNQPQTFTAGGVYIVLTRCSILKSVQHSWGLQICGLSDGTKHEKICWSMYCSLRVPWPCILYSDSVFERTLAKKRMDIHCGNSFPWILKMSANDLLSPANLAGCDTWTRARRKIKHTRCICFLELSTTTDFSLLHHRLFSLAENDRTMP